MKNIIAAVTLVFFVTTLNAAELISKLDFTMRYVAKVEATYPGVKGQIVGPLEISFTRNDGTESKAFLENAYIQYSNEPYALDETISKYVDSLQSLYVPDELEIKQVVENIYPIIKNRKYITEIQRLQDNFDSDEKTGQFPYYYEQLNPELVVLYAFDSEKSMSLAQLKDIEALGIHPSQLRKIAAENLSRYLPPIQRQGDETLSMLIADGNYEASLLLLDDIWTKDNFSVRGEIVVFVPSRDIILVTGSDDREGLRKAQEIIRNNEWSYFISEIAYVRKNHSWVLLEP
ncbi:DUF1444 family protein [Alkalimonas sp. NCh-2]|uniref:DUF1444 family protein n=1 Tax=Alkalimonas sp. NCh-2 TaxID=3144846 RepID=UPI0031F6C512